MSSRSGNTSNRVRSTRPSTAGCTRTSSAGSASRARPWASARCSPGRWCAAPTAPTSSGTRPRRAVALWRTSALAAALALLAAGCGAAQHEASQTTRGAAPGKAQLAPKGQKPLTVEGTGFHPQEKVTVVAEGTQSQSVPAQADSSGSFVAAFDKVDACDSITVTATGSK